MKKANLYHIAGLTDLEKVRDRAYRLSQGDSRTTPRDVVIHHHRHPESCDGHEHVTYDAKEKNNV